MNHFRKRIIQPVSLIIAIRYFYGVSVEKLIYD